MIPAQEIVDSMAAALDAEGNDYYTFNKDYKYAINNAIEWCVGVMSPLIGTKKFSEESFSELTISRIWQTNKFSRISFDSSVMPYQSDIWTIMAIQPKPTVFIETLGSLSTPIYYYSEIVGFTNQELINKPIVGKDYKTGFPLTAHMSTIRPELSFIHAEKPAKRMTIEEWPLCDKDPFASGYANPVCEEMVEYGYINAVDYTSYIGGYKLVVPREIEIKPRLINDLVAVFYIPVPTPIALITDNIQFPQNMKNILVNRSLSFLSLKQGDGTNLPTSTAQDLLTLFQSKN